jgi:hypothetical protein
MAAAVVPGVPILEEEEAAAVLVALPGIGTVQMALPV